MHVNRGNLLVFVYCFSIFTALCAVVSTAVVLFGWLLDSKTLTGCFAVSYRVAYVFCSTYCLG